MRSCTSSYALQHTSVRKLEWIGGDSRFTTFIVADKRCRNMYSYRLESIWGDIHMRSYKMVFKSFQIEGFIYRCRDGRQEACLPLRIGVLRPLLRRSIRDGRHYLLLGFLWRTHNIADQCRTQGV